MKSLMMRWKMTPSYSGVVFGSPVSGMRPLLGAVGEADEVRDGLRGVVTEQVDADVAVVRVDGRDGGGNGHGGNSVMRAARRALPGSVQAPGT